VLHLAALPGVRQSLHEPESFRRTNVDGTVRLLAFCQSAGIPRSVFASSSSVYGPETPLPAREDGPVDPCSPHTNHPTRLMCPKRSHPLRP
jgi:UDP-glucuronate 4-epimerase